jgi:hypothetical protein
VEASFVTEKAYASIRAFWSGFRGDTKEHVWASFIGDSEHNGFAAPVESLERDSLGLGASFAYRLGESIEISLKYSYLGGRVNKSHQATLALQLDF